MQMVYVGGTGVQFQSWCRYAIQLVQLCSRKLQGRTVAVDWYSGVNRAMHQQRSSFVWNAGAGVFFGEFHDLVALVLFFRTSIAVFEKPVGFEAKHLFTNRPLGLIAPSHPPGSVD